MPITGTIPVEVKTAFTPFPTDAHSQVILIIARIEALQATNAFVAKLATHFRHWFNHVGLSTRHTERGDGIGAGRQSAECSGRSRDNEKPTHEWSPGLTPKENPPAIEHVPIYEDTIEVYFSRLVASIMRAT
jgi:hypothetical protein